jgi:hypothetical protein
VRRVHRPQQLGGQLRHRRRRRRQRQRAGGAVGRWAEEGEETARRGPRQQRRGKMKIYFD